MNRYHVGSDGEPRRCTAQQGKCPLGGDHFISLRDAWEYVEEKNEEEFERLSSWSRHTSDRFSWTNNIDSDSVTVEGNPLGDDGETYYVEIDLRDNEEAKRTFDNAEYLCFTASGIVDRQAKVTMLLENGETVEKELSVIHGDGNLITGVTEYVSTLHDDEDTPNVSKAKVRFSWTGYAMDADVQYGNDLHKWNVKGEDMDMDASEEIDLDERFFLGDDSDYTDAYIQLEKSYEQLSNDVRPGFKEKFADLVKSRCVKGPLMP